MIGPRNALLAIAGIGPTFGEKFADPATLPAGTCRSVEFSPAGDALLVTHDNAPFITAYAWSSSGFGAKYPNPASGLGVQPRHAAFHPSGSHVFVEQSQFNNMFMAAYQWSAATGFGSRVVKYRDTVEGVSSFCVAPNGTYLAVGESAKLRVMPWTGTNFGATMITTDVSTGGILGIDISPDSAYIATVGVAANLWVYPFSGSAFGSRVQRGTFSNYDLVRFNPAQTLLISDLNVFEIVSWLNPGFGTTVDVSRIPSASVRHACFSPSGDALAVAYNVSSGSSPLRLYRFTTENRVSNQFADPAIPLAGPVLQERRAIAFSPSGDALAVIHQNSPFITVYRITYNIP